MNTFSAVVRLGSDAEQRFTPNDKSVISFNGACDTGFGQNKGTLWVRCSYWRDAGKLLDYLKKGQQVFVTGELSVRDWQNNEGITKQSTELNVQSLDLVGGAPNSTNHGSGASSSNQAPQSQPAPQGQVGGGAPMDDDIPF